MWMCAHTNTSIMYVLGHSFQVGSSNVCFVIVREFEKVEDEGAILDEEMEEELVNCEGGVDPLVEDQKLKERLLQKYRGHIQKLRQQFMRKRKKGKLPKEARQRLLEWWNQHYKWPYPTVCVGLSLNPFL